MELDGRVRGMDEMGPDERVGRVLRAKGTVLERNRPRVNEYRVMFIAIFTVFRKCAA